jgi:Na+(H+)/acetate symporter ActP
MYWQAIIAQWQGWLLWGFVATAAMTSILSASQGLGLSRLSLPFLTGTFFVGNRYRAQLVGFVVYLIGGWIFALLYLALFVSLKEANWWIGMLIGLLHGLFLLLVVLPLLPHLHPRMATEYDGPSANRRLEPPGFMGLHYGFRTPVTTLLGQAIYGLILGFGLHVNT